jgi:hypothetical protein
MAASRDGHRGGPVTLSSSAQRNEPGEVIDNLLDDVNNATRSSTRNANLNSGVARSIDTSQLAALSITFEVV